MRYTEQMMEILAPLGLDKHNDFKIDRETLAQFDTPRARWLWVVDAYGTHLIRLGVDEKESGWGSAAVRNRAATPFLLEDGRLKSISADVALTLLQQHEYDVRDNTVFRGKHSLADFIVDWKAPTYRDPAYRVKVTFLPLSELSIDDLVALRYVAIGQAVRKTGTLFCRLEEVYVDSTPLLQRLQARQQALRTLCVDEAAELETI